MTPTHTTRNGNRRYRYYVCQNAQRRGWHVCPSKSVSAPEIERFVVDQVRCIGRDPALLEDTLQQVRIQDEKRITELEAEKRRFERELRSHHKALKALAGAPCENGSASASVADLQECVQTAEQQVTRVREDLIALRRDRIDEKGVAQAMSSFDPVWETLSPHEQLRAIRLLVQRVDYDGEKGTVSVTFHPAGIQTLADELEARNP